MYNIYDDSGDFNIHNMRNKLLCTFTPLTEIENLIEELKSNYTIKYGKIFVLKIKDNNDYVCTYNIDLGNINDLFPNTILVHRNKEFNVLYTINSLNELVKSLNGGIVDTSFKINWQHYKNSILLTQQGELKFLKTNVHKIIEI